jgi:hypothetical protein
MGDRYQRGLALLDRLDREQGARILAALEEVAPDFARLLVEFAFGDICARPGLDLKTREIATVAALTALGTAPAQLRVHIKAALQPDGADRGDHADGRLCGVSRRAQWPGRRQGGVRERRGLAVSGACAST